MSTENLIYLAIILSGIMLFVLFVTGRRHAGKKHSVFPPAQERKNSKKPVPDGRITEIFDYGNIRIMHENGMYTINDSGRVMTFKSWRYLPVKYQKMVKQVDAGTIATSSSGYFLDNINGIYYVTTPNGKKKKYKSLNDIPEEIRKIVLN